MAYRTEFADAVKKAIGNTAYRKLAPVANVSPAYIADMVQGRVPKPEVVVALARATKADERELLNAAGYRDWEPPYDANRALLAGFAEISERTGKAVSFDARRHRLEKGTPEEVDRILREIEADLEEP